MTIFRSVITLRLIGCMLLMLTLTDVGSLAFAQSSGAWLYSPYYGTTTVSQNFSTNHRAYDYLLRYTQVLAAASGTIRRVAWYSDDPQCHQSSANTACGYGLHVRMSHANGYWTIYGHLSTTAYDLGTDGAVARYTIGTSGHTGFSSGPHLHFEVRPSENGAGIDPSNPNIWKGGQFAIPTSPIPAPANLGETLVYENTGYFTRGYGGLFNNQCPVFSGCGTWLTTSNNPYPAFYTIIFGQQYTDAWARWRLTGVDTRGRFFEVFVHIPSSTIPRTWQAAYTLISPDQGIITTGRVDQAGLPNSNFVSSEWVSLGTYFLKNDSFVYTTDVTGEASNGHCPPNYCDLLADAVKFVQRPTHRVYLPLTIKN